MLRPVRPVLPAMASDFSKAIVLSFIHFRPFPLPDTLFALNLFLFTDFYNIDII
jgi:hypothetical protein